ncbi:hypothetical protein BD289DRAFT_445540 [Coniella lustricola]|uniref:Uncharacterized protein n=1 Tax=Coniella lustricola TaxID=2025994 RepID=A0A2T2ZUW8_9PEZI|nr:hypothetical protein BD289DRAFT_445540 [Coniella lustricola]
MKQLSVDRDARELYTLASTQSPSLVLESIQARLAQFICSCSLVRTQMVVAEASVDVVSLLRLDISSASVPWTNTI